MFTSYLMDIRARFFATAPHDAVDSLLSELAASAHSRREGNAVVNSRVDGFVLKFAQD
jgi:hypothetical protein